MAYCTFVWLQSKSGNVYFAGCVINLSGQIDSFARIINYSTGIILVYPSFSVPFSSCICCLSG